MTRAQHSSLSEKMHWALRIGVAGCFIGHGAFGLITKEVWCNDFAVFGIGRTLAYQLMPVVGTVDITVGVTFLLFPIRAFEWVKRAGSYTALFALWLAMGPMRVRAEDRASEPFDGARTA